MSEDMGPKSRTLHHLLQESDITQCQKSYSLELTLLNVSASCQQSLNVVGGIFDKFDEFALWNSN